MSHPTPEWIEKQVELIMINHGPDGHTDGSEYITRFIVSILNGNHLIWAQEYQKHIDKKQADAEAYQKQQEEE